MNTSLELFECLDAGERTLLRRMEEGKGDILNAMEAYRRLCFELKAVASSEGLHDVEVACEVRARRWGAKCAVEGAYVRTVNVSSNVMEREAVYPLDLSGVDFPINRDNEVKPTTPTSLLQVYEGYNIEVAVLATESNIRTAWEVFAWLLRMNIQGTPVYSRLISPSIRGYIGLLHQANYIKVRKNGQIVVRFSAFLTGLALIGDVEVFVGRGILVRVWGTILSMAGAFLRRFYPQVGRAGYRTIPAKSHRDVVVTG